MSAETGATVIVSTDGSSHALYAAKAGLALLAPPARVVIVTALSPNDEMLLTGTGLAGGVVSPQTFDEMTAAKKQAGEDILERTAAVVTGVPVETRLVWDDPGRAICETAEELGAAAIVMGSRGLGGVKRFFLGSVSTYVVRNAPCPVLVVPTPDED